MHVKIEKAAVWLGLAMIAVFIVVFVFVTGFIPPYDPSASAAETAARFADNELQIRIGMAIFILLSFLFAPFFALVSRQVRRIEGYWGVMSVTQILLSVTFPFGFAISCIFATAAAYRPEANPDVTQALSDMFWLIFVGLVGPLITQVIILALAVFIDKRAVPSFPRWYGYFNIWYAVFGVPGCAVYLFKNGPLAWNGLFAFWIPLTVFIIWFIVTAVMLIRAVDVEAAERAASAAEQKWEPAA